MASGTIAPIHVNFTEAGDYSIKFKATAWEKLQSEGGTTTSLKFYPAPSGDENSYAFATFTDVADKTTLGTFIPETKIASSSTVKDKSTGKWPDEVETFEYSFKVPAAGKYVFEWVCQGGNSSGIMFGNYTISKMAQKDLSTDYVKKLNNAVALAETRLADAAPAKYQCREYDVLSQAIAEGKVYKGNFPSKYDSVVAYVNDRSRDLKLRMDTVDLFYTTQEDVATALAAVKGDSVRLAVYQTLNTHMTSNANFDCSTKTTGQITAEIEGYKSEMKALEDRLTLMENYATLIQETKSVIDAAKRNDFDEYAAMVRGYNTALQYNVITPTDAEISAAHDALVAAKNGYVFRYDYFIAKTRQTRELYAFVVDTLGYDFGAENAVIKSAVEEYVDAAPHMDSLLRETAILQILKLYQAGDFVLVKKDMTFEAQWKKSTDDKGGVDGLKTVTYLSNGGKFTDKFDMKSLYSQEESSWRAFFISGQRMFSGKDSVKVGYLDTNVTAGLLNDIYKEDGADTSDDSICEQFRISRENYTFAGWRMRGDKSGKIYKTGDIIPVSEDITFIAVWKDKSGTLTLFEDVNDSDKYFYKPVYWAYEKGITTGTSPTEFSPDKYCTREQFVTFLWRYSGSPEPKKITKFSDVDSSKFYYKAVMWAAEQGITTGYNGTDKFGVGDDCTREQCVTFIYRAAKKPKVSSSDYTNYGFTDAKSGYYKDAVTWAAKNGVTKGVNSSEFGVGLKCTRGQLVTFLQRYADLP